MRLFCECGRQLSIAHSVKIDLMSNFTYHNGILTLTKHQIRNSQNIKQKLTLDEIDKLQCRDCGNSYKGVEKLLCQCDECGVKLTTTVMEEVGDTIVLCVNCLSKYKHFQDFKIFGLRGPDKRTRKKRYDESMNEVSGIREMPEEIQRIYEEGIEGRIDEIPFDSVEVNVNDIGMTIDVSTPPQEQTSSENRLRGITYSPNNSTFDVDVNTWRSLRRNQSTNNEERNE